MGATYGEEERSYDCCSSREQEGPGGLDIFLSLPGRAWGVDKPWTSPGQALRGTEQGGTNATRKRPGQSAWKLEAENRKRE